MKGALHNWQYLFIIEGSLTGALAIVAWFWMPMGPGSAWFLSPHERDYATQRIKIDVARYVQHTYGEDGLEKTNERLSRRDLTETGKDWKLWYVLVFNICASVPGQAFSVFLPLVVKGLGYTSIQANLVSFETTFVEIDTNSADVCAALYLRGRRIIYICIQLG